MPYNCMSNPWQINDSDHQDEINTRYERSYSLSSKPPTPKVTIGHSLPKIADWDPVIDEERQNKKSGHRKIVPSFEKAPSHHKPIFSGSLRLKSSSYSSFESIPRPKTIITYTPETPPASPPDSNSNIDPFKMIQENLNKFIYTFIPKEHPSFIRCVLRRDKTGLQKGFLPTYYLHVERPNDGKKIFLLAARKVAKFHQKSEYLITTNIETLSEKSGGDGYVGKLRAHNDEYTLYDNGKSPNKYGYKPSHCKHGLRRELAGIIYNTNILGLKARKEVNTIIPKLKHDIQPAQTEDTILDLWRDIRFNDLLQLRNRSLKYTESSTLQFTDNQSIQPSVKNFQMLIETENHEEEIVMQFGRISNDTFLCNFRYPLSTIQAFAIALSSFDNRVFRE